MNEDSISDTFVAISRRVGTISKPIRGLYGQYHPSDSALFLTEDSVSSF